MIKEFLHLNEVNGLVEDFLIESLDDTEYLKKTMRAVELLTYNRFDLALKLAYLELKNKAPSIARNIYFHDIRSQTLGSFEEFGNENKKTFDIYVKSFCDTFLNIELNGFDSAITLIPLSLNGTIVNGAHRVSSAIYLNKDVACIETNLPEVSPNYMYFYERNVPSEILDIGAIKFSEYSENTYLAFLWPSGRENYNAVEQLFSKVVYKKKIELNSQGGLNLLVELYKHMDWIGSESNNFPGAHQKLFECFTDFKPLTVIMFQSDSLEQVQALKKKVRAINGIGFSSIHITDTKEEAIRISKLIFNENGLHFLNHAKPYKIRKVHETLKKLGEKNKVSGINQDFVLGGSMTLGVYGLRDPKDVDYIANDFYILDEYNEIIEPHDSQLEFHKIDKVQLIYNPNYYFEYLGFKFFSFNQTFDFKRNRGEAKDVNDCEIMKSIMERKLFRFYIAKYRQIILYKKILLKRESKKIIFYILNKTSTYNLVRKIYRKYKSK
ncbi:hypothetical protein [Marinomonas shanghaiensis]|uniref:hypothetical protein n=1 Tax=Marinomonas shanghaiensis TaxID=2202418 RepID=UPI000DBA2282|nr:hypothetical protein [Marinomonas shanghaiensis]